MHGFIFSHPSVRPKALFHIQDIAEEHVLNATLGLWFLSTCDIDPIVAQSSRTSWSANTIWSDGGSELLTPDLRVPLLPHLSVLSATIGQAISTPHQLVDDFNPSIPVSSSDLPNPLGQRTEKSSEERSISKTTAEETFEDMTGRLRTQGLSSLAILLREPISIHPSRNHR